MKNLIFIFFIVLTGCVQNQPSELQFNENGATVKGSDDNISLPTPTPTTDSSDYTVQLQTVDRTYVSSKLINAFDAQDTTWETQIRNSTYFRPEFGGACDRYAASESDNTYEFSLETCSNGIQSVQPSYSNPMRYAYTEKLCNKLVADSGRFSAITKKIFSDGVIKAASGSTINKAYGIFFTDQVPNSDVQNALLTLAKSGTNDKEGWVYVLTALCISPEWQAAGI